MHHSRLCAVLIDCKTSDVDEAARFWAEALGRHMDPNHPSSRGNYRMPGAHPCLQHRRLRRVPCYKCPRGRLAIGPACRSKAGRYSAVA
jgi:hypothetical protein